MSQRLHQRRGLNYPLSRPAISDDYVLRSREVDNGSICVHLETSDSRILSVKLTTEAARDPSLLICHEEVAARKEGPFRLPTMFIPVASTTKRSICKVLGIYITHIISISEGSSPPAHVPSRLSSPGVNSPAATSSPASEPPVA
jgi:hypothetical protein